MSPCATRISCNIHAVLRGPIQTSLTLDHRDAVLRGPIQTSLTLDHRDAASQPQSLHHHTSEHSSISAFMVCGSRRSPGQTTQCRKPGPNFCSARAAQKSSTRIQTHQNLFTLTKNIAAPQQPSWEQTSNPRARRPLQERRRRSIETDFPCKYRNPVTNNCPRSDQWSVVSILGGGGRDRTDDLLLAKQALYQLSYAPCTKR